MPTPTRTLTVNFVGKTQNLDKAFKRVSKGSTLMSDRMRRAATIGMGAFAGIGASVIGAAAALKPMIDAAADVDESLAKNRVLFGDAATAAERFAKSSAESFGISRREALEAVGVFGSLTHAMGMSGAEGVDMSVTMTQLAADMASFNNASVEETLIALQAGLRGEAEPLRRFGVLLDAATLKAKALEMGLIENEKNALKPQEKALAAYQVILEQTSIQQGDFARTSDGLANQQKKLAGLFDDVKVEIGEGLLPVLTDVTAALTEHLLPAFKTFIEDPSFEASGSAAGQIWWAAFGGGLEEASADDTKRGFWTRVFTPPAAIGVGAIAAGVRWGQGFMQGVDEAEIRAGLEVIFDRAFADLATDAEDFFNFEAGLGPEFRVDDWEGWPAAVDPATRGMGPITGPTFDPFSGLPEGVSGAFSPESFEITGANAADLSDMTDALEAATAGQAEVEAAFDLLLSEIEDLRLATMGEEEITGTGPGLAAVGAAQTPPPASSVMSAQESAELATWLAGGGFNNIGSAGATNITIVAPAVTGQEVWDAMGDAVKSNGPMPPHWQGSAS